MPMATMSLAPASLRAMAWPTTSRVLPQISIGSCSTQPARGKICWCSFWPTETTAPSWSKIMQRVLVVPWSMAATYWLTVVPLASSRWGLGGLRSEGDAGQQAAQDGPDERADDRHPGVAPVAVPLAADRQHGVRDARAQVAGGVDGVAGRSAEGDAEEYEDAGSDDLAAEHGPQAHAVLLIAGDAGVPRARRRTVGRPVDDWPGDAIHTGRGRTTGAVRRCRTAPAHVRGVRPTRCSAARRAPTPGRRRRARPPAAGRAPTARSGASCAAAPRCPTTPRRRAPPRRPRRARPSPPPSGAPPGCRARRPGTA